MRAAFIGIFRTLPAARGPMEAHRGPQGERLRHSRTSRGCYEDIRMRDQFLRHELNLWIFSTSGIGWSIRVLFGQSVSTFIYYVGSRKCSNTRHRNFLYVYIVRVI